MTDPRRHTGLPLLKSLVGPHAPVNYDLLKKWLATQNLSAQNLITGSLQAGQDVGSANYVTGESGWQITGDGDAEFNDVTVRGQLQTDTSGEDRIVTGPGGGFSTTAISFVESNDTVCGIIELADIGGTGKTLRLRDPGGGPGFIVLSATRVDGNLTMSSGNEILATDGNVSTPGYAFADDSNTGMYRSGNDVIGFAAGGSTTVEIAGSLRTVTPLTSGTGSNLVVSSSGLEPIRRSTSARKYKTHITDADLAGIKLQPVRFYRKDDERWFYGFIADDLGDQDELLGEYEDGEIENYDHRAVMAVMAAKINKQDDDIAALRSELADLRAAS